MPTKQFFNLAEEKRNILLQATIDELNRVSISDFSINQVVKNAGIARGSFYIYFQLSVLYNFLFLLYTYLYLNYLNYLINIS